MVASHATWGHRRFLHEEHPFRSNTHSFDGIAEHGPAPIPLSGTKNVA